MIDYIWSRDLAQIAIAILFVSLMVFSVSAASVTALSISPGETTSVGTNAQDSSSDEIVDGGKQPIDRARTDNSVNQNFQSFIDNSHFQAESVATGNASGNPKSTNKTVYIILLKDSNEYTEISKKNKSYIEKKKEFQNTSYYKSVLDQLEEYGSLYESTINVANSSTINHYVFYMNAIRVETSSYKKEEIEELSFVDEVWNGSKKVKVRLGKSNNESSKFGVAGQSSDSTSAEETWQQLTNNNWGYTQTGLRRYHEGFAGIQPGAGIDVTVIDTGFDKDHPLFNPIVDGEVYKDYHVNVVSAAYNGLTYDDMDGHGTQDLGVVWQAAPFANYHVARFASYDTLIGSIVLAPSNVFVDYFEYAKEVESDVITTSVYPECDDGPYDGSHVVSQAASDAVDQDTVVIASAGNWEYGDGCEYPTPPSTGDNVISVSSTFLSLPSEKQLVAPGASPNKTYAGKPNVAAPGFDIETLDLGGTTTTSGSSFAAPHVAGIAALLSKVGNANEVRDAIYSSAIDINSSELDGNGWSSVVGAHGDENLSGNNIYPDPTVNISDITVSSNAVDFKINLKNDRAISNKKSSGVYFRLTEASVQSISLGGFDYCIAADDMSTSECDQSSEIPSGVVELYVEGDEATSGVIKANITDPQLAKVQHRGWIRDSGDTTFNPYAHAFESYIARTPDEGNEIDPKTPKPQLQNNPPFSRAAHNSTFDITQYPTHETFIGPSETSLTASPESWDLGSVSSGSNHDLTVTIENTGDVGTDISVSGGSGLSISGVPSNLEAGQSASFTVTLDADNYNGDSITISYAGGEEIIPISLTVVDDDDLIVKDSERIYDPHDCTWLVDVWGSDAGIACNDEWYMEWVDDVYLNDEVMNGFSEATLYVEFATDPNQEAQDNPLDVYVNGELVTSLDSPPGGGEFETRALPLSETDLRTGDNTVRLATSGGSTYQIGSDTELHWEYFEPPDLDLSFGDYPDEVEPGTTFELPVAVENDGGRTAESVWLGYSNLDAALEVVDWPDGWGSDSSRNLEPGEMDVGYFTMKLTEETEASGEIATGADNADMVDRSFYVSAPNDPPLINSHGVSPDEIYPDEEAIFTAAVDDPDGDSIDITLDVYIPSTESWQTYGTQTLDGSGTADFSLSPFSGDDIGEVGRFKFNYADGFGNSGTWGPFSGPTIDDPNLEAPSFDSWQYPAEVGAGEDFEVSVEISDSDGVAAAEIKYIYPNGTENRISMSQDDTTWSATIPAPADATSSDHIEFVVYATDAHEFPKTSESVPRYVPIGLSPVGNFDNPPTDQTGDGLHRDVNGDLNVDVADVQALFAHLDDSTIQNNVDKFDFANTGNVTVIDVQKLFNYVVSGNDGTTTNSLPTPATEHGLSATDEPSLSQTNLGPNMMRGGDNTDTSLGGETHTKTSHFGQILPETVFKEVQA